MRVLSIQSHVVSGYVGNRAATFPLQTLGYDVDVINTVQFSNHTGYGHTNGHKTTAEQLKAIFEGLETNGLLTYDRVLTGYVASAEALRVIQSKIEMLRDEDPTLIYVLDPVMGDIGKGLYVSQDVVPIYRDMLKSATVITPNQFEVELLSGVAVSSLPTLYQSLLQLHNQVPHVAFSSIPLPASLVASLDLPTPPTSYLDLLPQPHPPWYDAIGDAGSEDDILVCFASTRTKPIETWAFALPTIRGYFSGVGDLFSAMVTAHFDPSKPSALMHAVSRALLVVQQILLQTHLHSLSLEGPSRAATPRPLHPQQQRYGAIPSDTELDAIPPGPRDTRRKAKRMRVRELRLIPERNLLQSEGGWPGKRLDWTRII